MTVASYENGSEPASVETNMCSNLKSIDGWSLSDQSQGTVLAMNNPVFLSRIIFDAHLSDIDANLSSDL